MDKITFRKEAIENRKSISNKQEKEEIIIDKLITLLKGYKLFAMYAAKKDEVNIDALFTKLSIDKSIYFPKVIGDNLIFIQIKDLKSLEMGLFGVREPIINNKKQDIPEVIIVPGVAFSINGDRLGYGKGYYDKYLKDKNILKVGVCFSSQLYEYIPTNSDDIKMDIIITESDTLIF